MKEYKLLFICLSISTILSAQRVHIGVFGGLAAYNGDLTDKIYPKKVTNGAIGITVNYELRDQLMLRGGFTYAVVGGADRYSDNAEAIKRNLSFETSITEFSLIGEYYLNNLNDRRYSPYAFAGLAIYHFNPYAFNGSSNKIFLKPLSTEGQGLPGYPSRNSYSLTQAAIPFGGGLKFVVTEKIRIGVEVGFRKLFTDYLDDVSSFYADPNDLLAAKGQLSVDMSYRGDELPNGDPAYPAKSIQRGNQKSKDLYYFTGIHLTYRLGGGSGTGLFGGGKRKYGCPSVPL
jgi:hypothetical protein